MSIKDFKLSSLARLTSLFFILLLPGQFSWGDSGMAVVANKISQLESLNREEVASIFLGKRKIFNQQTVIPVDINDTALHDRFYLSVADMNGLQLNAYWSRIVFSGQGRPPQELSIAEAIIRLHNDPGVIIYLPANQITPDMKIVFSIP